MAMRGKYRLKKTQRCTERQTEADRDQEMPKIAKRGRERPKEVQID